MLLKKKTSGMSWYAEQAFQLRERASIEPTLSIHVALGLRALHCSKPIFLYLYLYYHWLSSSSSFSSLSSSTLSLIPVILASTICSDVWNVCACVDPEVSAKVLQPMLSFWQYFKSEAGQLKTMLSVRDLLAWAAFINLSAKKIGPMGAFFHGVELVLLDGIGLGTGMSLEVCAPS